MCESVCSLVDAWSLRNAAAEALMKTELHLQRLVAAASVEQLVTLIEAFSPTRALGPDLPAPFEPLVERLWAWGDPTKLAAYRGNVQGARPGLGALANDFTPTRGAELRERLRRPAWARLPAFTLG